MTADMAFECLLVSHDAQVVGVMNRILENLSIATTTCVTPVRALEIWAERSADLIVLDWENSSASSELLRKIWNCTKRRKPTIMAISALGRPIPGAHLVMPRPITMESGAKSLRVVYSRMLQDHRRSARYALMISLTATDQDNRKLPITLTDISQGGVGFRTKEELAIEDVLKFELPLPRAPRPIHAEARVLWTKEYGSVGCEFLHISEPDQEILRAWLDEKCQVKKPVVEL